MGAHRNALHTCVGGLGIIVEGPDGSWKTFTAAYLSAAVNLPIHHSGGPPKNHIEIFNRALKQIQLEDVILDRCVILTDMVYSPVVRGEVLFDDCWLKLIKFPVVYCRPSLKTILKSELTTKPWKSSDHLSKVKDKIDRIINAYDGVMGKIPHIRFNRDSESLEDLCAALICVLGKNISKG